MTITPTPLVPGPAAGTASAAAGTGKGEQAAAAGFGALLAQLAAASLAAGKIDTALGNPDTAATPADQADALLGEAVEDGEGQEATAVVPGTSEGAAAAVAPALAVPVPVTSTPPAVSSGADGSLAQTAVRGVTPIVSTAQATPSQPDLTGTAGEQTAPSLPPGAGTTADDAAAPAGEAAAPTATLAASDSESGAAGFGTAAPAAGPAPASPASATAGAASTPTAGVTPNALLDQVTPVVSRMVGAGEGSHRMVLRLHPADLGEVQLTVTVRGDSVDVTLAAGADARELLASGSHELRGLLDSIGRTAGQITFKDLPGTQQLQQAALGLGNSTQPDAGQQGTSYGSLADGSGDGRDGRGGSERPGVDGRAQHSAEPEPARPSTTKATPGNGAVDVRI